MINAEAEYDKDKVIEKAIEMGLDDVDFVRPIKSKGK